MEQIDAIEDKIVEMKDKLKENKFAN